MKVFALAATGGTGRLIVRFRPGERPFRKPSHRRSALISVASKSRLIAERMNPFKQQLEDRFEYES
jgi:hypothetical protein